MKKILLSILVLSLVLSFSGCWSSVQPKNLAIVNSVIYDIDEENNYLVTLDLVNPSAIGAADTGGGGSKSAGITVNGKGKSYSQAMLNVTTSIERKLFADHNKVRFLTDNLASKDYAVINMLDFIMRDVFTDETALMIVIKNEDKDKIYNSATLGLSNLVGSYLSEISENQPELSSNTAFVTTLDFITACYAEGRQPVAGYVHLEETDNVPSLNSGIEASDIKYKLIYDGLAVFKDYKFVGYMDGKEGEVYNILTDEAKFLDITVAKGEDYASAHLLKPKAKIKVSFDGQNAAVDIKVKGSLIITKMYYDGVNEDNYNQKIKELEQEINLQMKEQTLNTIFKAQGYESDIFGFGSTLHSQNPMAWKTVSSEWDNYFKNASVTVEYDIKVVREGETVLPFFK